MIKLIIHKISIYNIFNYLFSGIIFVVLIKYLDDINLYLNLSILYFNIINLFILYFIGLTISRVGSLIIEPFYRKYIIKFADYSDFIKVEKIDKKLNILSEQNNVYRTFTSLFLILIVFHFIRKCDLNICTFLKIFYKEILIIFLFILYAISYYKQTKYITDRIKYKLEHSDEL
ncbi:hypothetical protein [Nitratiruptor tergarcus]|uniref:Uncharacterized protein n=1 Tax=Nitratiruptor tergarcus DSM 16512 TaxID=1069081 RepID=A0A1W1WT60_9BACT|nr:hypothetical protein [Nitratiruptor tergarcus]SMC09498.1 hypothetical protein SAMN05660197_1309 [Nitratiruptor tergarcus DSM 16512]